MDELEARRRRNGQFGHALHSSPGAAVLDEACPVDLDELDAGCMADAPDDLVARLQEPHRDFATRTAMALRPDPDAAERAASDPDPVVRAVVLCRGTALPETQRRRLLADPRTMRAVEVLGLAV